MESDANGYERAAVVLFRRLHRVANGLEISDRYLAVEIIPFDVGWVKSSSPTGIHFELKGLREIFRRCEEESLVFGFVHNHPLGQREFSDVDGDNEKTLLRALCNRNGSQAQLVALLLSNGNWTARVRSGEMLDAAIDVRHIAVLSERIELHGYTVLDAHKDSGIYARQAAAFGEPFVNQLRSLRVCVVGAGGTGSAVATLLARAGIGELVIIDPDEIEKSNLNRLRGAGIGDVGKNKAEHLRNFITALGIPVQVTAYPSYLDQSAEALDALSTCDLVVGCTDDSIAREALNAALYIYAIAYIDIGLGGGIGEDVQGDAYLKHHFARVSTILPEFGECLFCQGAIDNVTIRREYALRENPTLSSEEVQEKYLAGGAEEAPGVGPFTSAAADYAVATLFDLVRPFRKFSPTVRRDYFTVDFVKMELRSKQEKFDNNCVYCRQHYYLLRAEEFRLNRPVLGKPDVHI